MATSATSGARSDAPLDQLLVVIDPEARRTDGESVRIARDVLSAGAPTKLCLPETPAEFERALSRLGSRRPVVIGDDDALLRAVSLLHRRRDLAGCSLSLVPVGSSAVAEALGVPTGAVAAARTALDGAERRRDLLEDDSGALVLGGLTIPAAPADPAGASRSGESGPGWLRAARLLVRGLVPAPQTPPPVSRPLRLRVEVDGAVLVDLARPVGTVTVRPADTGAARIEVRPASPDEAPLYAEGATVHVSGEDFRYRADATVRGPVRRRTWTVREKAWAVRVPR